MPSSQAPSYVSPPPPYNKGWKDETYVVDMGDIPKQVILRHRYLCTHKCEQHASMGNLSLLINLLASSPSFSVYLPSLSLSHTLCAKKTLQDSTVLAEQLFPPDVRKIFLFQHTHTHSHTHTLTHSFFLSPFFLSLSLSHTHTLSLSLSHCPLPF